MATSLNSILDTHPEISKANKPPAPKPTFTELAAELAKRGMRHGPKDRENLSKAHDAVADMVDGANCTMAKAITADLSKANARHSKADLDTIKAVHDSLVGLGAVCPGHKETSE